jgi:hypothetical protein
MKTRDEKCRPQLTGVPESAKALSPEALKRPSLNGADPSLGPRVN